MYVYSYLPELAIFSLICIFLSPCLTECKETHDLPKLNSDYCPFVETLSFGADFDIKCNSSSFIFNVSNNNKSKWVFINPTPICAQSGTLKAYINECGVERINSNYVKASLISLEHQEKACAYCQINYQPISALITVTQSEDNENILYTFNITATRLVPNESFEILLAKRINDEIQHSSKYWFSQNCIDSDVKVIKNIPHQLIFTVRDILIGRVEFIVRRCKNTCRKYLSCLHEDLSTDLFKNQLRTPDAIERIICDSDCLNGVTVATTTSTTKNSPYMISTTSSVTATNGNRFSQEQRMKLIIIFIGIGIMLLIILIIIILFLVWRLKGKKYIYKKTNHTDPDEFK